MVDKEKNDMSEFSKLEAKLGITFKDPDLCKEAFTHKSFAAEHDLKYDNQRLELLGDAVVQIIQPKNFSSATLPFRKAFSPRSALHLSIRNRWHVLPGNWVWANICDSAKAKKR